MFSATIQMLFSLISASVHRAEVPTRIRNEKENASQSTEAKAKQGFFIKKSILVGHCIILKLRQKVYRSLTILYAYVYLRNVNVVTSTNLFNF